jgi:catechol 2,3-dioxygenase-like lactoylglutathione lyase family enzyme
LILGLEHVQLAMPAGRESEARQFYSGLLGIPEVAKPPELAKRGGAWFESDSIKIHLGVEADFRPSRKAHPALLVRGLRELVDRLREAHVEVVDEPLEGYFRVYTTDPFGNRIELMEPGRVAAAPAEAPEPAVAADLLNGKVVGRNPTFNIHGKCHCGNIALEIEWAGDPHVIPARVCGCSFCVGHGNVWTADPSSGVTVLVRDDALVSRYAFGTRTATFHVCSRCGAVPVVTSEIAHHLYAVINVNVLLNIDPSWLRRGTADFDGEDVESRLARRKRNWIPNVRLAKLGA